MKRFGVLLLALVLVCISPLSAFAAAEASVEERNALVAQKETELEKKFGISIQYPTGGNGLALINVNSLLILEQALDNVTANVVQQVSAYYKEKNGNRLLFSYVQAPDYLAGYAGSSEAVLAGFDDRTSLIELYIPRSSGEIIAIGENPISIVHEFGHAVHLMYTDQYGFDKMKKEWSAFNGDARYQTDNIIKNPNDKVFVTGYAATDFAEDVAETFAHAFVRNQPGQGFSAKLQAGGKQTGLGKKVAYVEAMLSAQFKDASTAVTNYRRIYNTPNSVVYQGMKFSGDYLQFAGYSQPRYVLNGTLRSLGKQREKAVWLRSIGGWYVLEPSGQEVIIFPGGYWCSVGKSFQAPNTAA